MPIESVRTQLRRITLQDFDNVRILESDPDIMKFIPALIPQTEEQTRERLSKQIAAESDYSPFGIWVAELKTDNSFVGWFMLRPSKDTPLELGFMLVPKFQKMGLATEVSKALIDFAFNRHGVKEIIAHTNIDNFPSIRVLTKLGFTQTGNKTIPEPVLGGQIDLKIFTLVK